MALILLGWELRASYITVLCVQAVLILPPLLFMPSLHSHSLYAKHGACDVRICPRIHMRICMPACVCRLHVIALHRTSIIFRQEAR